MSLIIQAKEKSIEIAGAIFTYRPLPFLEQKRMLLKYTINGEFDDKDSLDMGYDMMKKMITGWKDVLDEDKNPIEFDAEIIKYFDVEMALEFMTEVIMPSINKITEEANKQVKKGKKKRTKKDELENLK